MEDLIYRFICLCKKWYLWKNAEITAGGKKYTDCGKKESPTVFRNLKNIRITESDKSYGSEEDIVFCFDCQVDLEQLFRYGIYEIDIEDMPYELKLQYIEKEPELLYDWESFMEEVENKPSEALGIDLCDFDQYSEYEKIKDELVNDAYVEYIENLFDFKKRRLDDKTFIDNICKEFFEFVRSERLFPIIEGESIRFCRIGEGCHGYNERESYFLLQCWRRMQ